MTADLKLVKNASRSNPHIPSSCDMQSDAQIESCEIDQSAAVAPSARIGPGTQIGPFAVIGQNVVLGSNCIVHPHGVVTGPTTMGEGNEVYPFACVGGAPQDLRHRGEDTVLEVGDNNIFREHVTVGRGTVHGGGRTIIGNNNLLMACCHVAHDCILGDNIVMANNATLAGHVQVQDFAVFGGMAAVGAFLRIGESAMVAANSMVERDVPPFSMIGGDRAVLKGMNRVGLQRRGVDDAAKREIKEVLRALKLRRESPGTIVEQFELRPSLCNETKRLIVFLKDVSRGLTR